MYTIVILVKYQSIHLRFWGEILSQMFKYASYCMLIFGSAETGEDLFKMYGPDLRPLVYNNLSKPQCYHLIVPWNEEQNKKVSSWVTC